MISNVFFLALQRLRGPLITLVLVYAASICGLIMIPGTDAEGNTWHMDFFHALYFVSFMGSTIGFGELPYPFNPGQRLWVLFCIYFTVSAWLYAIGSTLALLQEPSFTQARRLAAFRRTVRNLQNTFYIICGYGDTGRLLVRGLAEHNIHSVVIDNDQDQLNELKLTELRLFIPAFHANAEDPNTLIEAGLKNPRCAGVIGATRNDLVNLKIAISTKLLAPEVPAICRSELHDVGINMESFGTDHIINPFDIFADRLATAVQAPNKYLISEWLTAPVGSALSEPVFPPKGRWVLCGYGRFGKAVQEFLSFLSVETTIVELRPKESGAPDDCIVGRGTEAVTLREAGIEEAQGIIAGTGDDVNNLSIVMTAREINEGLFMVARQNRHENDAIFDAASLHMTMKRSDIVARRVLTLITNPLLADFLDRLHDSKDGLPDTLAMRIRAAAGEYVPRNWVLHVSRNSASALAVELFRGRDVRLGQLIPMSTTEGEDAPVPLCLPLMLRRGDRSTLLPEPELKLDLGDKVLFCGQKSAQTRLDWVANNATALKQCMSDPVMSDPAREPSVPPAG